MKKINFDIVLESSSLNQLNRDFGEFFNLTDLNDNLFCVKLIEGYLDVPKINDDFNNLFRNVPKKLNQIDRFHHSKHNDQDFNFSFGVRTEKVSYQDINLSFNSLFGETLEFIEDKKVQNFFHKKENDRLQVEFNENFDKDIFLKLNENFESFFDCEKVQLAVSPIPQMNFDIFRENVSINFKTLNHEFSSYFPKLEEIPQNKNVKQLKESLEEVQDAGVVCDFNLRFIDESFDKLEFNQDFENFFDIQTDNSDNLVSENSVVKALDIDLTRRRFNKESLETFKSDPLGFFAPESSSKSKFKDEIVKETDQIIDNKIQNIEEKYNSILNSELDQIHKNNQKSMELLKKEHDRKLNNMLNEFNLFKKMMVEQMSSVKSTFLSATSGGGAVNILDMHDVDKSNLQNGSSLSYNSSLKKFELVESGSGANNVLDMEDVDKSNLQNGYILSYNSALEIFEFVDAGSAGSTSTLDLMHSFSFNVTQEDIDNGYYDLPFPSDPNYYHLSEITINGMQNNFPDQYNFITTSKIDISTLSLAVDDKVRVIYIKS